MDVILDSNILVRDLWLESQAMRVFQNYLMRTHSRLLMPDAVLAELRGTAKRDFAEIGGRITATLREARRKRLLAVPDFAFSEATQSTLEAWEANFTAFFSPKILHVISSDASVLPEAVRRSAERLAPCKTSGEGIRDAIIWLTVIAYLRAPEGCAEIAFITANTSDFANANKDGFRPELILDLSSIGTHVHFFRGLSEFNKNHGNQISHLTLAWVKEKGAGDTIERKLSRAFNYMDLSKLFRVTDSDLDDIYLPEALESIVSIDVEITNVSVWQVGGSELEIGIDFDADVTAETVASLSYRPAALWGPAYIYDLDDPQPSERSLTSFAQITGTLSARREGDEITFGDVENIQRR